MAVEVPPDQHRRQSARYKILQNKMPPIASSSHCRTHPGSFYDNTSQMIVLRSHPTGFKSMKAIILPEMHNRWEPKLSVNIDKNNMYFERSFKLTTAALQSIHDLQLQEKPCNFIESDINEFLSNSRRRVEGIGQYISRKRMHHTTNKNERTSSLFLSSNDEYDDNKSVNIFQLESIRKARGIEEASQQRRKEKQQLLTDMTNKRVQRPKQVIRTRTEQHHNQIRDIVTLADDIAHLDTVLNELKRAPNSNYLESKNAVALRSSNKSKGNANMSVCATVTLPVKSPSCAVYSQCNMSSRDECSNKSWTLLMAPQLQQLQLVNMKLEKFGVYSRHTEEKHYAMSSIDAIDAKLNRLRVACNRVEIVDPSTIAALVRQCKEDNDEAQQDAAVSS